MRIGTALLATTLLASAATAAGTGGALAADVDGAVFTMTNSAIRGNEVVAYERTGNGSLRLLGAFATGGQGSGPAPTTTIFGAPVPAAADGLGSQGSLRLSDDNRFLFAVNAGSNSVTCFRVNADGPGPILGGRRTAASGGVFPVSLAFRAGRDGGGVLYALNSGERGSLTGFRVGRDCSLSRIAGGQSARLNDRFEEPPFPSPEPNEVLTTLSEVGFTPNGRQLVVAFKGGPDADDPAGTLPGGAIAVFGVDSAGRLAGAPTITEFESTAGDQRRAGPFSFVFDEAGNLLVNHANSFTFASYRVRSSGTLAPLDGPVQISGLGDGSVLQFGAFNCWVTRRGDTVYVMSIGDLPATSGGLPDGPGVISALRVGDDGSLELLDVEAGGAEGVVAIFPQDDRDEFDPGEDGLFGNHGIDLTVVEDGDRAFLYAIEPRVGQIGAWEVNRNGTLRFIRNFDGRIPEGVDPFAGTNPGIDDFLERCFLQPARGRSPECRDGSAQGIAGF